MTPEYANGYVPERLLVVFKRGSNARDGDWYHGFPPAVYARHLALIRRALRRTGRTLALNYGWTAYRPFWAQRMLKQYYTSIGQPKMAATEGTSSHGGKWEGRQTMAGDYSNWEWVYEKHGGRAAFAEDVRAVGGLPNMIVPDRGYPDEPWHVVWPDPWGAVPVFDGVVLPFKTAPVEPQQEEDDDMPIILRTKQHGIYTASPGALVAHGGTKVSSGLEFRGVSKIMDVNPDDLFDFILDISGCRPEQIPAGGYMWIAAMPSSALQTIAAVAGVEYPSLDDIARAVQDEEDRRERERLAK